MPKNSRNCPLQPVTIWPFIQLPWRQKTFPSNPTSLNAVCKRSILNNNGFVQHCRKASWARPTYNSIGITMQRQETHRAVSIASPHKPLLVVKRVLERLEDTAWLSLIKWLWGCMTSRQCSSETQPVMTHGRVTLLGLVFHKRALWHSPRRSGVFCLAPTHPAFHDSATPPSLSCRQKSATFPAVSAFPECFIM